MADIGQAELLAALDELTDGIRGQSAKLSGAAADTAGNLRSAGAGFSIVKTAANALSDSFNDNIKKQRIYENAVTNTVNILKGLISSSISATAALYGAQGGFSSMSNTLGTASSAFNGLLKSIGDVVGTLGPYGQAFKFAVGGINFFIENFVSALQVQLTGMQKQLDSYIALSKAGATFGGSLYQLQTSIAKTGVPLEVFTKLVSSSADNLAKIGVGISSATSGVAGLANTLFRGDRVLANTYGNLDNLAEGVAEYMALQAQLGKIDLDNVNKDTQGLKNYLLVQKELTELTGKNNKTLKAEEERRRQQIAYQMRQAAIGEESALNAQKFITLMGTVGGPQLARMAEELHAQAGQAELMSNEMYQKFTLLPKAVQDMLRQGLGDLSGTPEDYNRRLSGMVDNLRGALGSAPKEYADQFAAISLKISGPLADIGQIMAQIQSNQNLLNGGLQKTLETMEKSRLGIEVSAGKGTPEDRILATVQQAEGIRLDNQLKIDKMFAENFGRMTEILNLAGTIQEKQIALTDSLLSGGLKFIKFLNELFPESNIPTTGTSPFTGQPYRVDPNYQGMFIPRPGSPGVDPNQPPPAPAAQPAAGTNVSQVGTEAVVLALDRNTTKLDELLRTSKDQVDLTQRLVQAA